jgi:hypothetical protein
VEWFRTRIAGYSFREEHTAILLGQRALLEETFPDWRDEAVSSRLWRDTQQEFNDKGLPVSFFSRQVGYDGSESVAFWYPRLILANGMLKVFQLAISQIRPA